MGVVSSRPYTSKVGIGEASSSVLKKVAISLLGHFYIRKIKKEIMFVGLCLMQNKGAEIHLTLNKLKKRFDNGTSMADIAYNAFYLHYYWPSQLIR